MRTRGYTEVCPPLLFRLTNPNSGSIMSWSFGLVAQLGAHHIRIVGVGSSNLLKSTKRNTTFGWCSFWYGIHAEEIRKIKCGADERAGEGLIEPNND